MKPSVIKKHTNTEIRGKPGLFCYSFINVRLRCVAYRSASVPLNVIFWLWHINRPFLHKHKITVNHPTAAPEFIIVHDGPPSDSSAKNYYVKYKDYIKNVASSEIYATWPEATLYANILAIQSITLNRVYTEWSYSIYLFCIIICHTQG